MSRNVEQLYELWKKRAVEDPDLIRELEEIAGDADAVFDRFYRELDFGTAGLRGVIGAGDNRMNIYTVRKATQGLANYLRAHCGASASAPAVAIAYDCRIKSDLFAREAARVLAAAGITVYLFDELEPTPVLSFAVRELRCQAGIMVTASHNPAKYNGYKCYGPNGGQMTDDDAGEVTSYVRALDIFDGVTVSDFEEAVAAGLIRMVGQDLVNAFLDRVEQAAVNPGICRTSPLKVIYSPLNGTGNKPVRAILSRIGVTDVTVVPEQEQPDGTFPTTPFPNPEFRQVFEIALEMAKESKPDLLLATDPDADRVGIAVRQGEDYVLTTGNEVGCLLLEYILSSKKAAGTLPAHPMMVKTIVTSDLAARIAEKYGCATVEVLTGFKYIGEQIDLQVAAGHPENYILGFEESYGYLSGTHVRDKDAVVASMLICEMAAYYKSRGKTLLQVLEDLYREHGVYRHSLLNAQFEGAAGMEAMNTLMERLRQNRPAVIAGIPVVGFADYRESVSVDIPTGRTAPITLPKSNVLSFRLEGNNSVIVRPSGTEPKIKAYITATGADGAAAAAMTERLSAAAAEMLKA